MHILLLPSWYATADKPWRGTFVADQARALARAGHQVGLAFVERRSLSRLTPLTLAGSHFQIASEDDEFRTIRMKGWSTFAQTTPGSILWTQLTRLLVRRYVERYGVPDVVHGHAALWGGYAAMRVAHDLGRSFVITEHSSSIMTARLSAGEREAAARVYRSADAVLAVSRRLADAVDAIAGSRVASVVPNTVDTDYFHLPSQRVPNGEFTFLAVCDLVDYKRVDLLISAFARVHIREPQSRLVIVGAGKEDRRLRALAEILGVEKHVRFTGALPRWRVRLWMWEADAVVLASAFETFGVVLIEALSTGLPVIATQCGGPQDVVSEGDGTLVVCGDEEGLLASMIGVIGRRGDATARHESVRRRFGYAAVAARLDAVYGAALARRANVVPMNAAAPSSAGVRFASGRR